jgi:hypothetical protein
LLHNLSEKSPIGVHKKALCGHPNVSKSVVAEKIAERRARPKIKNNKQHADSTTKQRQ